MANKITTMGYFVKRLRDNGYIVDKLFINYALVDSRAWSVVIDPGCASIFCTCYQNDPEPGEFYFELHDGGKFIPSRQVIKTNSIEELIGELVKFNINNKHRSYPQSALERLNAPEQPAPIKE